MSNLTTNSAGGLAYSLEAKETLAKYAVTGSFTHVRNLSADVDTKKVLELLPKIEPEFIAKVAKYSAQLGRMKDMPVVLVAYLSTLEDKAPFYKAFDAVCDNVGQITKFVKVIRDGVVGRKSLGTAPKRAIQKFFESKTCDQIFWQAQGSTPSIGDVIKLARPRPTTVDKDAFYAYLIDKPYKDTDLPSKVTQFEAFKRDNKQPIPDVPFNRLTSFALTPEQWKTVFKKMTWNQLRKNINTAGRKGLFVDQEFVQYCAKKIASADDIARSRVLPFSLVTSIESLESDTPPAIREAFVKAIEYSSENAPEINGNIAIILDVSGSMGSPVLNNPPGRGAHLRRGGTSCVTAASYFAGSLLKKAKGSGVILPVDIRIHSATSAKDKSVHALAKELSVYGGGGTDLGIGMAAVAKLNPTPDLVVVLSDNESWVDQARQGTAWSSRNGTTSAAEWKKIKEKNPKAKLVCWDLTPNPTTQVPSSDDVMNLGGLSDVAFEMITIFYEEQGAHSWVSLIEDIKL